MTAPAWQLHLGDCAAPGGLASLAAASVDVVITDPPYSEYVHTKGRAGATAKAALRVDGRRRRADISRSRDLGFEHITPWQINSAALEFARVTRRWVLVFSDTESSHLWRSALECAGLEYVRTCFWRRAGAAPQFSGDRPAAACEAITCCHPPGRKRWNGGGKQGFYDHPIVLDRGDGETRVHTTQKPLALMDALVRDFSEPGELVLDAFAGSASTGVAAIRADRHFVGWEKDLAVHAIATKRLSGSTVWRGMSTEQLSLFCCDAIGVEETNGANCSVTPNTPARRSRSDVGTVPRPQTDLAGDVAPLPPLP